MTASVHTRTIRRLVIDVEDFDDFRTRYEAAAPAYDLAGRITGLSNWDEVQKDVDAVAPYGFVRYATIDGSPVFAVAGHEARSIVHLMGNHTIAETMYRHDPGVLLYAPLRVCLYEDLDGAAHLSVDQPSDQFGSLGHPDIDPTGHLLDDKLAALLTALGASVRKASRPPDPSRRSAGSPGPSARPPRRSGVPFPQYPGRGTPVCGGARRGADLGRVRAGPPPWPRPVAQGVG